MSATSAPASACHALAVLGRVAAEQADASTIASARSILVDSLACALAASRTDLGAAMAAQRTAGGVDAAASALANLVHLEEHDCLHDASATAPGVVVAAAVAVGLERGATLGEILAALVAGVEVTVRLGEAVGGSTMYAAGFWPTSLCAKVGAAAAVAQLVGLDVRATSRALAIAAISGPSALPRHITESHYLSSGIAVRAGVEAASWAERGISADELILDDGPVTAERSRLDLITGPSIREVALKRYPCARPLHAVIAGVRRLVDQHQLHLRDVDRVTVAVPHAVTAFLTADGEPSTPAGRRCSVPYVVRLALGDRADDLDSYRHPVAVGPDVEVELDTADQEVEARYPAHWCSRVTILTGGRSVSTFQAGESDPAVSGEDSWAEAKWRRLSQDDRWVDDLISSPVSCALADLDPLGRLVGTR